VSASLLPRVLFPLLHRHLEPGLDVAVEVAVEDSVDVPHLEARPMVLREAVRART